MSDVAGDLGRPSFSQRFGAAIYDRMAGGMEKKVFGQLRRQLLEAAYGRVLDVGAGTGANLPHYRLDRISKLVLLDVGPAC